MRDLSLWTTECLIWLQWRGNRTWNQTWQKSALGLQGYEPGGCFTNVSRAFQNNLAKIYNASNQIYGDNFKLKLCTCAQSMALGTRTKFQLEMVIGSAISATNKFRENILESSRNVNEATPRTSVAVLTYFSGKSPIAAPQCPTLLDCLCLAYLLSRNLTCAVLPVSTAGIDSECIWHLEQKLLMPISIP